MKLVLTLLALSLVGCGTDHQERLPPAYVAELNLYPEIAGEMIIGYGETQQNASGECIKTSTQNFIVINESAWKVLNNSRRKALILHELGHCVYNREHDTRLDNNGNLETVMFPNSLTNQQSEYFMQHEQYYINEVSQ